MPVIFFKKPVEKFPEGFKKVLPRTRLQKLKYKTDLLKQMVVEGLAGNNPTPKNLEQLGEHAEKLLLGNEVEIFEAPTNKIIENNNINFTSEEVFAPEGYAESLTAEENAKRAAKRIEREEIKTAVGELTAALGTNVSFGNTNTLMAADTVISQQNILSGITRHEQYLAQAQALKNEAIAALRTHGLNKDVKHKALKQLEMAKSYMWLATTALESYKKNLSKINSVSGGRRKRHVTHGHVFRYRATRKIRKTNKK